MFDRLTLLCFAWLSCTSLVLPARADEPRAKAAIDPFWAFQAPEQHPIPDVRQRQWPRSDIDCFVLARLEASGLHPAPDADRRTLVRRAYFDLIGLPPSPAEIEAFLADEHPDAFARLVDRLLASPQFGERWGRHWLDVARFAESTGGGRTRILEDAWRYRDYVIDAFNRDEPFDQFLSEQIAGDLLPYDNRRQRAEQLTATSFLVLGPHNYELQDKELLRMEVVDEQLETVGRAFLGLAIGCARCHDHKFDPISTADYYALAGIFRSTKTLTPGNVSGFVERELPVSPEHRAALEAHRAKVKPLEEQLAKANAEMKELQDRQSGGAARIDRSMLTGIVLDDRDAEVVGTWQNSTAVARYLERGYLHDQNAGKGEKSVTFTPDLPEAGNYEVRLSYAPGGNRAPNTPVHIHYADGEKVVTIDQRRRPPIDGAFLSLGRFRFEKGTAGWVRISNEGTTGHVIADAVQFIPADAAGEMPQESASEEDQGRINTRIAELGERIKHLQSELTTLNAHAPAAPPLVMSVLEEEKIEDCPLLIRGNVHNEGDLVPRGFIASLEWPTAPKIGGDESGRRELARWLASPNNPLTARVIVNRIWHHLFGAGLVRTVDNFGSTGERPSHPELLDWLALRFIDDGWSVKRTIRRIMLSRVYQLSSMPPLPAQPSPPLPLSLSPPHPTPPTARERKVWKHNTARDPENRLLWRQNRRRLEAEALRDAILTVSGQLDLTQGGPAIPPETKSEFDYRYTSRRRSVYVPVFRNTLHPIFAFFDFAEPNLVTGRRNTSTLPTQALYLMNDPWIMDQARLAAEQLLAEPTLDDGTRLDLLYLRALGRPPTPTERELALGYISADSSESTEQRIEAWSNLCQTMFACIDFRYVK